MMPQKSNPDIPELVRGKSGRAVGDLVAILTLLKSLPLAYNRDLQEDKENLFDVIDTAGASLHALTRFLAEAEFDKVRMRKAAQAGLMTATDLADFLATHGVPFRKAHGVVKNLVAKAKGEDQKFAAIANQFISKEMKGLKRSDPNFLQIERVVDRRDIAGGTSNAAVKKQMEEARKSIDSTKLMLGKMRKDISAVEKLLI